jgi:hypothetical protein
MPVRVESRYREGRERVERRAERRAEREYDQAQGYAMIRGDRGKSTERSFSCVLEMFISKPWEHAYRVVAKVKEAR